jgi:hypothetical protein
MTPKPSWLLKTFCHKHRHPVTLVRNSNARRNFLQNAAAKRAFGEEKVRNRATYS